MGERGDADVSVCLHGEAVEEGPPAPRHHAPCPAAFDDLSRADEIKGDEAASAAFGAVEGLLVGGEADPIVARAAKQDLVGRDPEPEGAGVRGWVSRP